MELILLLLLAILITLTIFAGGTFLTYLFICVFTRSIAFICCLIFRR